MGQLELATIVTPSPSPSSGLRSSQAWNLRSALIRRWREGEPADAAAALEAHPELRDRTLALDLLYEEYCLRHEAGETVAIDEFCARFPTYADSLRKLVGAHEYMQARPELWAETPAISWPQAGEAFLDFDLLSELGRGAFARVFLARQRALGNRLVAVKIAHRGAAEAETLGRLTHPNIVPVYSVQCEAHSGWTAVCMPYFGNATLVDVLSRAFGNSALPASAEVILQAARQPRHRAVLPEDHATADPGLRHAAYVEGIIHLGVQLADALAYTHAKNIWHLDLKPSNVLIRPDGRPMLLDFNLSRDQNLTAQAVGGTLPYMSPEQIRSLDRDANEVDGRSDIFSLGVILYELLSGAAPFGTVPPSGVLSDLRTLLQERHRQGPKSLCDLNPDVDRRLAAVIASCLAVAPADRPASAAALSTALARFLSPAARLRRWGRGHRRGLLTTAVLLVLMGVATGYGVASRPSYSVRQFEEGRLALLRGDYELALARLDEAQRGEPDMPGLQFARARAFQQARQFNKAEKIYLDLLAQREEAPVLAALGSCYAEAGHWASGVKYLNRAIDLGETTPEALRDLGWCYRQISVKDLPKSEAALRRACQLKPDFLEAHEKLVLVHLRGAMQASPELGKWDTLSPRWKADVETALANPNAPASLHFAAARLYARMAALEPRGKHEGPALDCLETALRLGMPAKCTQDLALTSLRENPRFQELVKNLPVAANVRSQ